MEITTKLVDEIAHLSRLELNAEEKEEMVNDLQKILTWADKLNALNTDDIEPLVSMSDNKNMMRKDVTHGHLSHYDALKNAPKKDSDYIRVPKVIE